jgi:hypothetical protein
VFAAPDTLAQQPEPAMSFRERLDEKTAFPIGLAMQDDCGFQQTLAPTVVCGPVHSP